MMRHWLSPFLSGALFSVGLMISGMTRPSKVVGFLDFFGSWDPSLAFVMVGALVVYALLQSRIRNRPQPFWAQLFHVPERTDLDARLVSGAALFGIGWGLAGYCPGPALTSAFAGGAVWIFLPSMAAGMLLFNVLLGPKRVLPAPKVEPRAHSEAKPAGVDG